MAKPDTRYWDSCCFLGHFKAEPDKAQACADVLTAASEGKLAIVTSTLTLTEVVKIRNEPPIPASDGTTIDEFFKHGFIIVRQLDRITAELARRLVWESGITPKDAIHLATALRAGCRRMDTTDRALLAKRSVSFEDYGPVEIKLPSWDHPVQPELQPID